MGSHVLDHCGNRPANEWDTPAHESLLWSIELRPPYDTLAADPRHDDYEGLDGQTVALNDPFDVGGYPADHPGDPGLPASESVSCRCTVAFRAT